MSITFDWIINPIVLLLAGSCGIVMGLVIARVKLMRAHAKILKLETDLLNSNGETLEAQKAFVELESRLKDQVIPVIPMKIGTNKENSKETVAKA
jgi:hypothetical protein